MGIFNDSSSETLFERIVKENPIYSLELKKLFSENIYTFFRKELLNEKLLDYYNKLGKIAKMPVGEEHDGNIQFKLDPMLKLYANEWSKSGKMVSDFIMKTIKHKKGTSDISYMANYEELNNGGFSVFDCLLNGQPSAKANNNLQKNACIVYFKDKLNPKRFIQLSINEISREDKNVNIGNFIANYKACDGEKLDLHLMMFPNMKRSSFNTLPGKFKDYVLKAKPNSQPLFYWLENFYGQNIEDASFDGLGNNPDLVKDNSELYKQILDRPEAEPYKKFFIDTNKETEKMYIPLAVTNKLEEMYGHRLNGSGLRIKNKDLEKRTKGDIVELDISKFIRLIREDYNGYEFNIHPHQVDNHRFSVRYNQHLSKCSDPNKKEYYIFQIYVHRNSSTTEGDEKFESFFKIENVADENNAYKLKINEIKNYNGIGLFSVDNYYDGNEKEHHLEVIEADHKNMEKLNEEVRKIVLDEHNCLRSAPDYLMIHNKIRPTKK